MFKSAVLTRLLLFLLTAVLHVTASAAPRVDILIPTDNTTLGELARSIQQSLRQLQPDLEIAIRNPAGGAANTQQKTLAITVGEELLPWAVSGQNNYQATLAFYIGSTQLDANDRTGKLSALYRDQPLQRQLALAKLLLPNLRRVAVIHSGENAPRELIALARQSGFSIQSASIQNDANWPRRLSQLMVDNDILLGIDDPEVYNRDTIRSILLTTYRRGKFLIGPNRPFVNAGSLASTYTTSEQYLEQLRLMVRVWLQQGKLPPPAYPRFYRIAINQQVASSLGLKLPDEKTLYEQMLNQIGECGDGC